jgi:hypothetical protein
VLKKKIGQFSKNYITFYPKIVTKLSKIWIWDPGSGKNLFRIPDPGVKKAQDPGSGSATLDATMGPELNTEGTSHGDYRGKNLNGSYLKKYFYTGTH